MNRLLNGANADTKIMGNPFDALYRGLRYRRLEGREGAGWAN
jgi:hypothetical protein